MYTIFVYKLNIEYPFQFHNGKQKKKPCSQKKTDLKKKDDNFSLFFLTSFFILWTHTIHNVQYGITCSMLN